jgi:hypothetical protein
MSQPFFFCLEVFTNVIIDLNGNTFSKNKVFNSLAPLLGETFHPQNLLKERPLDFIIGFLEVYFEDYPIQLIAVHLMYCFMQRYDSIQDRPCMKAS